MYKQNTKENRMKNSILTLPYIYEELIIEESNMCVRFKKSILTELLLTII